MVHYSILWCIMVYYGIVWYSQSNGEEKGKLLMGVEGRWMEEINTGTSDTHTCFGGVWGHVGWREMSTIHKIILQQAHFCSYKTQTYTNSGLELFSTIGMQHQMLY